MPAKSFSNNPQRTGENHWGVHTQPGSTLFLMTSHHLTWSWHTQKMQLKIDLSGGRWLNMALCTLSGASSYWLPSLPHLITIWTSATNLPNTFGFLSYSRKNCIEHPKINSIGYKASVQVSAYSNSLPSWVSSSESMIRLRLNPETIRLRLNPECLAARTMQWSLKYRSITWVVNTSLQWK